MEDVSVRVKLLNDVLDKKIELLTTIYTITENQGVILSMEDFENRSSFLNEAVFEKQKLIDEVMMADDVFESMYQGLKDEIVSNKEALREFIAHMQERIRKIMDLDIKIRVREEKNRLLSAETSPNRRLNTFKASKKHILDQYSKNSKKSKRPQ